MARVLDDFIKETSETAGTGTYTLDGAVAGFQSFGAVGDGNTCLYSATDGTDWEVGIGTYTASGTTLARTTILSSSNGDAAVSWSGGITLRVTLPASKAVTIDGTETLTNKTLTAPVINDLGLLDLSAATELTISSGAITVTQSHHTVDTESDAASDDLDTITAAGGAGNVLILKAAHDARSVVLKHGTGNLNCIGNADITLDDIHDLVLAVYDGSNWTVAPLTAAAGGGMSNLIDDTTPEFGGPLEGKLILDDAADLTISGGQITVTQTYHGVSAETGSADDLDDIQGGTSGQVLILHNTAPGESITIKHNAWNIKCAGDRDFVLTGQGCFALMIYHTGTAYWLCQGFTYDFDMAGSDITDVGLFDLSAATEKTISSGAITVTQSHHTVDTESDAATDDLDTINAAGGAGNVLFLKAANGSRDVVLKHNTGNLRCIGNNDITLDDIHDLVLGIYDGTNWTLAPLTAAVTGSTLPFDDGQDHFRGAVNTTRTVEISADAIGANNKGAILKPTIPNGASPSDFVFPLFMAYVGANQPDVDDDVTSGYDAGSIWADTTNKGGHLCLSNADGSARWELITRKYKSVADAATIDLDLDVADLFKVEVTADRTFTFSRVFSGRAFRLVIKQDSTGGWTSPTWPSAVKWENGVDPSLNGMSDEYDAFLFLPITSSIILGVHEIQAAQ